MTFKDPFRYPYLGNQLILRYMMVWPSQWHSILTLHRTLCNGKVPHIPDSRGHNFRSVEGAP